MEPRKKLPPLESMAELVDFILQETGMNQTSLAEIMGVTQSHVSRVARSAYEPKVGELRAIAQKFNNEPLLKAAILHYLFS